MSFTGSVNRTAETRPQDAEQISGGPLSGLFSSCGCSQAVLIDAAFAATLK
jgi:hypothetical protein